MTPPGRALIRFAGALSLLGLGCLSESPEGALCVRHSDCDDLNVGVAQPEPRRPLVCLGKDYYEPLLRSAAVSLTGATTPFGDDGVGVCSDLSCQSDADCHFCEKAPEVWFCDPNSNRCECQDGENCGSYFGADCETDADCVAYNCSTNVLPSSLVDQSIIDENDYRLAFTAEHAFCDFAEGRGGGWGVCKIDQETF